MSGRPDLVLAVLHWIEYLGGRPSTRADDPLVTRVAQGSRGGEPVRSLLLDVLTSRPFLTRATEELP